MIKYSPTKQVELFNEICNKVAEGKAVRNILKELGVNSKTFYEWLEVKDSDLRLCRGKQYARALEERCVLMAEETLAIADDGTNDFMTITKGNETYNVENKEFTQRSKIRIEARQWLLSKMQPKKYGNNLTLSGEADNPLNLQFTVNVNKTDTAPKNQESID